MAENPETKLTKKIVQALNDIEGCRAEKLHAGPMGMPKLDVIGAVDGKMLYLEVKTPGNRPTKRQESTMKKWSEEAKVTATWADNVQDAVKIAQSMKN